MQTVCKAQSLVLRDSYWLAAYRPNPHPHSKRFTLHFRSVPQVPLRPHSYYELTNGCELILADIQCQYFIGELPEEGEGSGEGEGEVGGDYEQTQMYSFDLEEAGTESHSCMTEALLQWVLAW